MVIPPRRTLIIHAGFALDSPVPGSFPSLSRDYLNAIFRSLNDLPPSTSLRGYPSSIIAQLGYKRDTTGRTGKLSIPRAGIVIPCRAPDGRVSALHNEKGAWYSVPQPHIVNLIRAQFAGEIHLFPNTIQADIWATENNAAAIGLNGFAIERLSKYLTGDDPRIVQALEAAA